ncbi:hypothetical protein DH2020_025008 [Rehmannia glutinosa]|uniref:Uncharacterized protein n=1 Tax=Rehmannia glutinosa TaxID=99300 RepID=A0ABR0W0X4_REHGL
MEADEVMKLFDSCWFEHEILTHKHGSPAPKFEHQRMDESESMVFGVPNLQIRSVSARCLGLNESVIIKPKLEKILSGKEVKAEYCNRAKKNKRELGLRRSLSALEFEEVKGFMDLGFVFTEEDKTSSLVSIIPGLQKRREMSDVEEKHEISRPYLSEAWGVLNKRRGSSMMNWTTIPSVNNEINMKDHLRIWAQTVASNVR